VVDALLGTGLDRDVTGGLATVIERLNRAPLPKFSLDVPSGLHADTGKVLNAAVRAEMTLTFAHLKLGLLTSSGADQCGKLEVVDIGIPNHLYQHVGASARVIEAEDVARQLTARAPSTHKGSAGRVVAIAGSAGKTGAALLVARGALRAGAGLVTICTFPEAVRAIDQRVLEEMTAPIDPARIEASLDELLEGVHSVAIGPGLGLDESARRVVDHVVLRWDGVKIVDADATTHFAGRAAQLRQAAGSVVLTPHPGELGRLIGCSARDVESDRFGALARAVDTTGAVVLLKGPRTLVGAPGELPIVNVAASPALATAGAGDVLSGITVALACRMKPFMAACSGAYLHGRAAELWSERTQSDRGLVAHEVADELPAVIAGLASGRRSLTV
jgi:NAD(P)H-hydrate epimerase